MYLINLNFTHNQDKYIKKLLLIKYLLKIIDHQFSAKKVHETFYMY